MENKQKKTLFIVGGILAIVVVGYLIYLNKGAIEPVKAEFEKTVNGIYNMATGKCEPKQGSTMFYTCCYNQEGQQVDCNDATKILGIGYSTGVTQAIYKGTPGIWGIQHGVTVSNTGNMDIYSKIVSMAVGSSPSYPSGVSTLNTAYAGMINNQQSLPLSNPTISWSSLLIALQQLSPVGTQVTYSVNTTVIGYAPTAVGVPNVTKSAMTSFAVTAEGIDFTVTMST